MKRLIEKLYSKYADKTLAFQKGSYSQCGEDLIVDFLLTYILEIKNPTYLDIGAHHPYHYNNTFLFYKRGCKGVSVEPDPVLFDFIKQERPNDININSGVGFKEESEIADFYIMSYKAINTFSKTDAERVSQSGQYQIEKIQPVELININKIFSDYFTNSDVDFVSIDVEGLDLAILESLDFSKFKPKVFCVETILFSPEKEIKKMEATIAFLKSRDYYCYADTSINSIFVRKDLLKQ